VSLELPTDHVARREVLALVAERIARPVERHHLERLIEQLVALLEVGSQRTEFALQVAGAGAEDEPPVRHPIERCRGLGQQERIPVRHDGQVGEQAYPGRDGRGGSEGDERVERLMAARLEPAGAGGRVLGERDALPTGRLGGNGELDDRPGVEQIIGRAMHIGVLHDELHRLPLLA
jgi:hypothetical protein